MNNEQIRRIEIIMNSKLSIGKRMDTPQKEYTSSIIVQFFSLLSILSAFFCVWQATIFVFNIGEESIKWHSFSIAMTTSMSFGFLLITPKSFADFLLKRHMMRIIKQKPIYDDESNTKLKDTICQISNRRTTFQYLLLPILLMIGALLQVLELNPIWNTFAYIAPLCLIMIILYLIKNYRDVKNVTTK